MSRNFSAVLVLLVAFSGRPDEAYASAGNLDKPSIAVPASDPVGAGMYRVLMAHEKEFTGGFYVNTHSTLHYAGGTKTINALLADLAGVDGAVVNICFSKEAGATRWFTNEKAADRPCDVSIDHYGWGVSGSINLTIYLGGKAFEPGELVIPSIRGR